MLYTVYENRPNNRATVHRANCHHIRKHGGVSSTEPPTGEYHEGFETVEAAMSKARSTGRQVHPCSTCNPHSAAGAALPGLMQAGGGKTRKTVSNFNKFMIAIATVAFFVVNGVINLPSQPPLSAEDHVRNENAAAARHAAEAATRSKPATPTPVPTPSRVISEAEREALHDLIYGAPVPTPTTITPQALHDLIYGGGEQRSDAYEVVIVSTPGAVWRDDASDTFLKPYTPGSALARLNESPTPSAARGHSYTVNGSAVFKTKIRAAIRDLNRHAASAELIRKGGHITINEDPAPCGESWTAGCAVVGPQKIQIKNHRDSKYLKIVLIHEITHLSQGMSECVAVKAEIAYMNSSDEYANYWLRHDIEERLGMVC